MNQDTAFFVGADKIARMVRAPVFFVGIARTSRGHYEATLQLLAEPPYSGEGTDIIERYARAAEAHVLVAAEAELLRRAFLDGTSAVDADHLSSDGRRVYELLRATDARDVDETARCE